MPRFVKRTRLPYLPETVFAWHERDGGFERLSPPWEDVKVLEKTGNLEVGSRLVMRMGTGPFSRKWVAEHFEYESGRYFADRQVSGPFSFWEHRHRVIPVGEGACDLEDEVTYCLPFAPVSEWVAGGWVRRQIDRMFKYRHDRTKEDLGRIAMTDKKPLRVLISGASGLIGSALSAFLKGAGHEVHALVRRRPDPSKCEVGWDPYAGVLDSSRLEGFDAVVHLAGDSIASRWTAERKKSIRDSRVRGTKMLSEVMALLPQKPKAFISASAIGFYGDRGNEELTERSSIGIGFLPEVCGEWEDATRPAMEAGIRTVRFRTGIVLTPKGGALAQMLTPFKMGLGGVTGTGRQWMSWISLTDEVAAIYEAIVNPELSGPVNLTSPFPVTNREFTKTLGKVLGRPTIFPLPGFVVKLIFGEMGENLLLEGQKVLPKKLTDLGFRFSYSDLETALRFELGK